MEESKFRDNNLEAHKILFENRYYKASGKEFEKLFAEIMDSVFDDFTPIGLGANGDHKVDGVLLHADTVYQLHAPERPVRTNRVVRKIDDDFKGALEKWKLSIKKWIFVYKHRESEPAPEIIKKINEINESTDISVQFWGFSSLWNIISEMSYSKRVGLLGSIPTIFEQPSIPNCLQNFEQAIRMVPGLSISETSTSVRLDKENLVKRRNDLAAVSSSLELENQSKIFGNTMVLGPSGCGKTYFLLQFASDLTESGWQTLYVDAELTNIDGKDSEIVDYIRESHGDLILVIDNVNLCSSCMYLIIQGLRQSDLSSRAGRVRILMSSRPNQIGRAIQDKLLQPFTTDVETFTLSVDIQFVDELAALLIPNEDVRNKLDIEMLLSSIGNDLPLLRTAINQFSETMSLNWKTMSEYALNRRLRVLEPGEEKTGETILLITAVFGAMHCFVSQRYLLRLLEKTKMPYAEKVMKKILVQGHLLTHHYENEILVSVGHPSIADILLANGTRLMGSIKQYYPSGATFEELEDELFIEYIRFESPDLAAFLRNFTTSIVLNGRPQSIVPIAKAVLDLKHIDPLMGYGLVNLGILLKEENQLDLARELLEQSLVVMPDLPEGWINLSRIYSIDNKPEEAHQALKKALKLSNNNWLFVLVAADVLSEIGKLAEAQTHYEKAIELKGDDSTLWNNYGAFLRDIGKIDEAVMAFKKAIELQPRWIQPRLNLTKAYHALSKTKEARKTLAKAWKLRETASSQDLIDVGALMIVFEQYEKAEEALRSILQFQNDSTALQFLGMVLSRTNRLSEFPDDYEKNTPLNVKSQQSLVGIAAYLRDAGSLDEAVRCLKKVLSSDDLDKSTLIDCHHDLAVTYLRMKDYNKSEEHYRLAIENGGDSEALWHDRGVALKLAGKLDDALDVLNQYLEINPSSAKSWFGKARILTSKGKFEDAIDAYQQAVQIKPDYPEAWYNLGNQLLRIEHDDEAIEAYQKAIKHRKDYARAYSTLGSVYLKHQLLDKAKHYMIKSFQLDPTDYTVVKNYQILLYQLGKEVEAQKLNEILKKLDTDLHK